MTILHTGTVNRGYFGHFLHSNLKIFTFDKLGLVSKEAFSRDEMGLENGNVLNLAFVVLGIFFLKKLQCPM
jgi:hypothetical protein